MASECLILYLDSVSLKNGGLFNKIIFLNSDVIWNLEMLDVSKNLLFESSVPEGNLFLGSNFRG